MEELSQDEKRVVQYLQIMAAPVSKFEFCRHFSGDPDLIPHSIALAVESLKGKSLIKFENYNYELLGVGMD